MQAMVAGDKWHKTALHYAATKTDGALALQLIDIYLQWGNPAAMLRATDDCGCTALHAAAARGFDDVVSRLLEAASHLVRSIPLTAGCLLHLLTAPFFFGSLACNNDFNA